MSTASFGFQLCIAVILAMYIRKLIIIDQVAIGYLGTR